MSLRFHGAGWDGSTVVSWGGELVNVIAVLPQSPRQLSGSHDSLTFSAGLSLFSHNCSLTFSDHPHITDVGSMPPLLNFTRITWLMVWYMAPHDVSASTSLANTTLTSLGIFFLLDVHSNMKDALLLTACVTSFFINVPSLCHVWWSWGACM